MKRHPTKNNEHHEPSSEERHLTELISKAIQVLSTVRERRMQIDGMLTPAIGKVLDMYLTIAKNSLAEAQGYWGAGKPDQARQRLELAENELRFSNTIIQRHEATVML